MEPTEPVKKNLLDLQYNKYLQYYTTSVILLFTFLIGVVIAFFTKQLSLVDMRQMLLVGVFSIIVLGVISSCMLYFRSHQEKIIEEIKKLNL